MSRAERGRRVVHLIFGYQNPLIDTKGRRDAQGNHLNGVNFGARSRWFSFLADITA
jgi:hypothetical protein